MNKEEEKKRIKDLYDNYYRNCDDWSIEDVETRLRMDFMHPEALTQDEVYDYISELCYGKKEYFLIAHVAKTGTKVSVGEPTESFEAVNHLADIQTEEELRNSSLEGREINLAYEVGNTWVDNPYSYQHINTVEELIRFM